MKRGRERNNYYTDLAQWGEILNTPGVIFVNLQYGDCREELEEARKQFGVKIHEAPGLNLKDDLVFVGILTQLADVAESSDDSSVSTETAARKTQAKKSTKPKAKTNAKPKKAASPAKKS